MSEARQPSEQATSDANRDNPEALAQRIRESDSTSAVETVLRTDDRVLARVTDGIYRQPGSALRELISNAYDADATRVVIRTDRPRFSRIVIEDDGIGMSPETVAYMLRSIGGSAKRSSIGKDLGVTDREDATRSPGGRRLIGKIGIGLFSISQITRSFQLITKQHGDRHRTIASVTLRQFSDDFEDDGDSYEAGKVSVWREPATDDETQGTTLVLTDIRHQTRETLRSEDFWSRVEASEDAEVAQGVSTRTRRPPTYNVGRLQTERLEGEPELRMANGSYETVPWTKTDEPSEAFEKLVRAVVNDNSTGKPNPKLTELLDYYLQMIWQLSLAIPASYVEGHPFDLQFSEEQARIYELPSNPAHGAAEIKLTREQPTIRDALELGASVPSNYDFQVFIDDLELKRPVVFTDLALTANVLRHPLIFVGKAYEDFPGVPYALSGGPLEFQAYLMWAPRITPRDHQGSLVRIHGASGTLYDPTFMRYQVAELTRLRQTGRQRVKFS